MKSKYKEVLLLLRIALFGDHSPLPASLSWPQIFCELTTHTVAWLPGDILPELPGLDEQELKRWKAGVLRNMQHVYHMLAEQEALISLLEESGIHSVVLKGTAAAMNYPQPDYRTMGDVDLLVEKGKAEDALALMLQNGYQLTYPVEHSKRHYNLNKNGIEYEIHKSFRPELDELLFEGIKDAQKAELYGFEFPVLPELQNGLVFLIHTRRHLRVGIGLRHVLDWVMYADAVLNDNFWKTSFQPAVKALGLEEFARVMTRMGQLYLGLPEENRSFCCAADEAVCRDLMEYVLANGNFGAKNGKMGAAAGTLTEFGSVKELFVMLQKRGCITYEKKIRQYPFLRPFAWLMRIGDLLVRGLRRKIGFRTMRQSFQESRRRVQLLKKLGIRPEEAHKH